MDYLKLSSEIKKNSDYIKNQLPLVYKFYFYLVHKIITFFQMFERKWDKNDRKIQKSFG